MRLGRLILLFIITFVCATFALATAHAAVPDPPQITTDQPVYAIGSNITVRLSQLNDSATYYLWLQRPTDAVSRPIGTSFRSRNGTVPPIGLQTSTAEPAGTYTLSLSTSSGTDTKEAVAHFGTFGTDRSAYDRTQQAQIAGGGFTPNSLISVTLRSATQTVQGFPISIRIGAKGDFRYSVKVPPSAQAGQLILSATGTAFDDNRSATVSMPISVRITSVSIRTESSPTPTVERTARAEVSYLIIYPDNSPVTTSNNNSTLVNVIRTSDGSIVSQLPLSLTDASVGKWSAVWVPSFSANLSTYHFELTPVGFDDSYGNKGRGGVVLSDEFRVAAATPELSFEMSPTAQRTENVTVTVIAKYHDGSYFVNVTLFTASITSAVATTTPVPLVYNATTNQISGTTKIPVNAALGNWRITATVRDAFDNTGSGAFILQVIKARIGVAVKTPQTAERTTTLTVDAKLTYPDNTTVSPSGMPKGLNATLSVGNFTWFLPMSFNGTTGRWVAGYVLSQNATLGDYSITLGVVDAFGNAGDFAGTSKVVPARFRFALPQQSSKADPVSYVNIPVFVTYPNGTSLKNDVGEVMATFQNSTGTFTLPMAYNATDDRWHLLFLTPNTGLTFGVTLTFSFDATDMFGNAGSAPKAYDLIIGAGIQYLILAAIAGSIVPIALLAWAIFAISARRRKYKP